MPYDLKQSLVVGLVGDIIQNRALRPFKDEAFLKLVQDLRSCDAVLGNLEGLYHDWEMSYGTNYVPAAMVAEPDLLDDLKWAGITAASLAMNHAFDCGEAGLLATIENCRKHGLPVVGAGNSIDHAMAPAYIDTTAGRIAFFGVSTAFGMPEAAHAGPVGARIPGKPGVAVLRHDRVHSVPAEVYDQLERARQNLIPPTGQNPPLLLFGGTVVKGNCFDTRTSCNPSDLAAICKQITGGKKVADLVVQTIHCHENGTTGSLHNGFHRPSAPDFLIEFAHACIDAGADIVFCHGPHIVRGIEIYKEKPIFYSLGNFVFQVETTQRIPPHTYRSVQLRPDEPVGIWGDAFAMQAPYRWAADKRCYQALAPVCRFEKGELQEVRLVPLDLGFGESHSQRGRPVRASPAIAADILDWLIDASIPFGTEIGTKAGSSMIYMDGIRAETGAA